MMLPGYSFNGNAPKLHPPVPTVKHHDNKKEVLSLVKGNMMEASP
jgi:hypothetical protein